MVPEERCVTHGALPAADLGELGEMSLTELIIDTGINDASTRRLKEKGKLSRNGIAEGIINNDRKIIIREQLTDPRVLRADVQACSTISSSRAARMPPGMSSFSGRTRCG